MAADPYESRDLAELILRRFYPERTQRESGVLRDFLLARGAGFERYQFSVRVGQGPTFDETMPEATRRQAFHVSRKRIDLVLWLGARATLVEAKERVDSDVLGQLRMKARLFLEDHPEVEDLRLVAIGRYSDGDTLRTLSAEGIDVYLYELPPAE